MRYKSLSIILKAVALAISWLTLSPLLLILDGRWKLLPKWLRIVLFVLSPMTMIVFAAVLVACYLFYCDHFRVRYFVRPRVIENITGIRLPKYKIVEDGETWSCFGLIPDHTHDFTLEFKRMPDEAFYKELDEHFDSFEPGKYSYSVIWGNGLEAPKGESDKEDISFSIDIERGSKNFYIRVMEW